MNFICVDPCHFIISQSIDNHINFKDFVVAALQLFSRFNCKELLVGHTILNHGLRVQIPLRALYAVRQ
jgi:hypothetical protein